MTSSNKRAVVDRIHAENLRFYGTPQGRGFLRMLDVTFEERWIYLLELLQNALDAGAKRVSASADGDRLVFQHDGTEPLTADSVRAMSEVFRSTKGAATVGFMGIGFKSIFRRFRDVGVTGFGWAYRYVVRMATGERFQDRQLDLLGCVLPLWDDTLAPPDEGYTTRFELAERVEADVDLNADIDAVVPNGDRTVLALLAYHGLTSLRLDDRIWSVRIDDQDGCPLAVAEGGGDVHRWRLFIQRYVPSDPAVARLLERRRLQPTPDERDAVYAAAQREREVIGLLPVDEHDVPQPPELGRIYATMPTSATWPFRMQLHADWLVNVSRTGLPELEQNAWQESIISQLPGVIAAYVRWLSTTHSDAEALRAGFSVLRVPKGDGPTTLDPHLARAEWLRSLAGALRPIAMLPTIHRGRLRARAAADVVLVPSALDALAADPGRCPEALFGGPAVVADVVGEDALQLVDWLGLIAHLSATMLRERWSGGPAQWWLELSGDPGVQRDALHELWAAIAALSREAPEWADLPCVPTQANGWTYPSTASYVADALPSAADPWEAALLSFLAPQLPRAEVTPPDAILMGLRVPDPKDRVRAVRRDAREFFESAAVRVTLNEVTSAAIDHELSEREPALEFFVALAQWARNRNRGDLVTHLVVAHGPNARVVLPREALLAEPYAEHALARRSMWPDVPPVVPEYVESDPYAATGDDWRAFLEARGTIGPLRITSIEEHVPRWNTGRVSEFGGIAESGVPETSTQAGYRLTDRVFDPPIAEHQIPHLAAWLEGEYTKVSGQGRRTLSGSYYGAYVTILSRPASWVSQLQNTAWVPSAFGVLLKPADVITAPDPAREDAPVAILSVAAVEHLQREGVRFGTNVPDAPEIRRLQRTGNALAAEQLAALLKASLGAAGDTEEGQQQLLEVLSSLTIPRSDGGERVPLSRVAQNLGPGFRSSLGGWVVSRSDLAAPLQAVLDDGRIPFAIPLTTTGAQALEFLTVVWRRARIGEAGLADTVRKHLPAAYAYALEDAATDPLLAAYWSNARGSAMVFGTSAEGKRWAEVAERPAPVFDDLRDPLLRSFLSHAELVVTAGHLGDTIEAQRRVAEALRIASLSGLLHPEWQNGADRHEPRWRDRFAVLQSLLQAARDSELPVEQLTLRPLTAIRVEVRGESHDLSARLEGRELLTAGEPADFADEAAAAVLEYYDLEDDTKRTTYTTVLVGALDDDRRFATTATKFARAFAPHFDLSAIGGVEEESEEPEREEGAAAVDTASPEPVFSSRRATDAALNGTNDHAATEDRRQQVLDRVRDILTTLDGAQSQVRPPGTNEQQFTAPRPRDITPEQQQRGVIGEEEFMRRVGSAEGWGGMMLLADCRRDGCGFDFLCAVAETEDKVKVEVKTFTAAGRVVITPREWQEAQASRGAYRLVGFLDNGGAPRTWASYVLNDPAPSLQREGEWQLVASLEVSPYRIFDIEPT